MRDSAICSQSAPAAAADAEARFRTAMDLARVPAENSDACLADGA